MSDLTRFGVAMETSLLAQLDELAQERGSTRSELLRDLARAEVLRSLFRKRVDAYASVTLVYNHHVRDLAERLMDMQHELGDQVRSTMHVHLDHDNCLEVTVLKGRGADVQKFADHIIAERGVRHGHVVYLPADGTHTHGRGESHSHAHGHGHSHRQRKDG